MNIDLDQATRAREWLASAEHKWRLQTMQTATRYDMKSGEYKRLPTKVRRFLNGTPVGMIAEVLEVLRESAPYKSPVFNHECGDLVYYPTNTYINKDGNQNVTNEKDATYTIVQDLRLLGDVSDDLELRDASSCSEVSTGEYHWDETEIMSLPDGEQGITWRIDGVRRDDESGLLSYEVRKRQAVTQHTAPVTVKETQRSTTTVETWDNLYGVPGEFKFDPVKGGSAPAAIPAASASDGESVDVSVQENPDCTYKVQVTRTTSVEKLHMYSVVRDRFRTQTEERTVNAALGLAKSGKEYGGGTVTKYTSEMNEDGTWNNSVEETKERSVPTSSKTVRVTPRGTVTSYTDTNVGSAASSFSGKYGEYKFTKTPGGLFVNEYTSYSVNKSNKIGTLCEYDLFGYTHETTEGASAIVAPGSRHQVSGGQTVSTRYSVDDTGFVSLTSRIKQELGVSDAVVNTASTLHGKTESTSFKNQTTSQVSSLIENRVKNSVLWTTRVSKTEGNLRDVDITTYTAGTAKKTLASECGTTMFEHTDSLTETATSVGTDHETSGGGKTRRTSYSVDPSTGFVTKRSDTTTEKNVSNAFREVRKTARGTTVTVRSRNSTVDPTAKSIGVGTTVSAEMTPGGLLNTSETTTTPSEGNTGVGCESSLFKETDTRSYTSSAGASRHVSGGGTGGRVKRTESRMGDDGLWEVAESTTTEKPVNRSSEDIRVTSRGTVKSHTDTQVSSNPFTPSNAGESVHIEKTPGGLLNVTITNKMVPSGGNTGETCEKTLFQHSHTKSKTQSSSPSGDVTTVTKGLGETYTRRASLADDGVWDVVETTVKEIEQSCDSSDYEDALVVKKDTKYDNSSTESPEGGKQFTKGSKIQSITRQLTQGGRTTAVVSVETPVEAHTPVYHVEGQTSDGVASYHDGITFRNSTWDQVQSYIAQVKSAASYSGSHGTFHVSPSISVTPNKYGLFDGTVSMNTTFTPKAFAAGGSMKSDNWSKTYTLSNVEYQLVSVNPLKLLKIEAKETHEAGGGVGADSFEAIVMRSRLKGSKFAYNPGGQSFTYDLITALSVTHSVINGGRDSV